MSAIAVRCLGLGKAYGTVAAVRDLDLTVERGQILAVIGPSGCGKTTILRLLAGFERPDRGQVEVGGRAVAGPGVFVPPEQRQVGMVFQNYALFPHLSVADNVAYGLHRTSREARAAQVRHVLQLVGLADQHARLPHELSGGQQQRVALARALAPNPAVILLDEPFSNLDASLRRAMRDEVRATLRTSDATSIFVTHDQEEALFMGDYVAVMHAGRMEQAGTPEDIFHRPATRFVAEFMGNTDFLPGEARADGIHTEVGLFPQRVALPEGARVELAVRADDVTLRRDRGSKALVLARLFQGAQNLYRVRLPSGRLLHSLQPHTLLWPPGTPVQVVADAGHPLACFHDGRRVEPLD
ncbi:MAG: ABC transporter ATP-binding protein [Anaerolineales bacterium]|nr:ABC transporter ATP-binding protein [Anaerolineales bacterium]